MAEAGFERELRKAWAEVWVLIASRDEDVVRGETSRLADLLGGADEVLVTAASEDVTRVGFDLTEISESTPEEFLAELVGRFGFDGWSPPVEEDGLLQAVWQPSPAPEHGVIGIAVLTMTAGNGLARVIECVSGSSA
ncbi:hypothetical protein [Amycolatopsis sp. NPDC059657]|uniref:hypothetical protein n=1 Tax=Amycolatopsis sp. NPDC059657 TaxID=3346899 RepID=UPI00366DBEC6